MTLREKLQGLIDFFNDPVPGDGLVFDYYCEGTLELDFYISHFNVSWVIITPGDDFIRFYIPRNISKSQRCGDITFIHSPSDGPYESVWIELCQDCSPEDDDDDKKKIFYGYGNTFPVESDFRNGFFVEEINTDVIRNFKYFWIASKSNFDIILFDDSENDTFVYSLRTTKVGEFNVVYLNLRASFQKVKFYIKIKIKDE